MRLSLYARLAAQNIRKSRRLYVPYLLSGICMVMIYYVLGALNGDPAISSLPGGAQLGMLLGLGAVVIAVFSTLFLLYTSSFLMKQRSRELSLYNMLGMSKRHIVYIVFFETFFCAAICLAFGLGLGVLSSKAFQLALLRLRHSAVSPDFSIAPSLLRQSALLFLGIFLLIFLRGAFSVLRSNPVELMRESRSGEKPPRSNVLKALLGIGLLGTGYVMAISVRGALDAFGMFFIAVILVIGGTFECFSSASVFFLRILQANRAYYYKPNHFISVSSMRYRMKRNGTSLATICILSTMVLVMLSSVTCLYAGTEDSVRTRCPREIEFTLKTVTTPEDDVLSVPVERALAAEGIEPQNVISGRTISISGNLIDGALDTSDPGSMVNMCTITLIPLSDYNSMCGTSYTLNPGEALAAGTLLPRLTDSITLFENLSFAFAQKDVPLPPGTEGDVVEWLILAVPDEQTLEAVNSAQNLAYGKNRSRIDVSYAFDTGLPSEEHAALAERIAQALENEGLSIYRKVREDERADFESINVGFLFLGIMLSAGFLCAAVLSMYYKQITEGYEDQSRFEVMRKVGLSRKMIRKSINSQTLTMFFLPLITAGVHMAFAFPMLSKLLMVFGLFNTKLFILTVLVSFGAFSLLYILVYLITSRTYFRIVSGVARQA